MKMYYNYPRMIKDCYALMEKEGVTESQKSTIRVMIDECVMHFLEAHNVPFERQGEFLGIMIDDCPKVLLDYKSKKFS